MLVWGVWVNLFSVLKNYSHIHFLSLKCADVKIRGPAKWASVSQSDSQSVIQSVSQSFRNNKKSHLVDFWSCLYAISLDLFKDFNFYTREGHKC